MEIFLSACVGSLGSYAEEKIISADKLVPLPSSVDDVMAASIMLKGMTAQMLLRRVFKVLSSLNFTYSFFLHMVYRVVSYADGN
jgi:NADPH:quinone reductase-like Zn-dependent oxidoreductase